MFESINKTRNFKKQVKEPSSKGEMKVGKNDKVVVTIENQGYFAEGIAKIDGKVTIIPFALAKEKHEVQIIKDTKNMFVAKSINIIKKSENRIDPPCMYYGKCGGCDMQHVCESEALKCKTQMVKGAFESIAKMNVEVKETLPSRKQFEYRNKFALPLRTINNKVSVCMYRANSHDVIAINKCMLCVPQSNEIIELFLNFANKFKLTAYDECTGKGLLKFLVVRFVGELPLITIVINDDKLPFVTDLEYMLKKKYQQYSLSLNINKTKGNVILTNDFVFVSGTESIMHESLSIKQRISSASFMQVNDEVRDVLYSSVASETANADVVIDAYSGAGMLSAIISLSAHEVYGIEIVKEATNNANEICSLNNIKNLTNICGDCKIELPQVASRVAGKMVTIVLDPPRRGCDSDVIECVKQVAPTKLIYVSCNPSTLARDIALFLEKNDNYIIKSIQPFDMFPQTSNVETMIVLVKKQSRKTASSHNDAFKKQYFGYYDDIKSTAFGLDDW
ncbi:MAG: 23S rRNA (uracil(1939)-C(5))-methyltransferase RlmD [Clostridia bacterium]